MRNVLEFAGIVAIMAMVSLAIIGSLTYYDNQLNIYDNQLNVMVGVH